MYAKVPTPRKRIAAYEAIVGAEVVEEIRALAAPLRGGRVLHLTTTAFGAGAPDELTGIVPLMRDLGLDAEWQVVRGGAEYARANKVIGDALGGVKVRLPEDVVETWLRYNAMNAQLFDGSYDFVVVHDPQPAGIRQLLSDGSRAGIWIWHCHVDISSAHREVWRVLRGHLDCCYEAAIFAAAQYVRSDLDVPVKVQMPPVIDPLNTKDMEVDASTLRSVIGRYGIDPNRPFVCQIARFIKHSDLTGVIDAYRIAKQSVPELQLVLMWTMPGATPNTWKHFQRVAEKAGGDEDIHVFTNLNEVGNLEVNAFERAARVVLHRAQRKGFATGVAEASWKGRPVVADKAAVTPGQVLDGQTGFLVDGVGEMADRLVQLLKNPELADRIGRAGREHVREHFLITRGLRDYLALLNRLKSEQMLKENAQT